MKNHIAIVGIAFVSMPTPARGPQINLHISTDRLVGSELNHGSLEIGTGLAIPESRMKHLQRQTVFCLQFTTPHPLVLPDLLE